MAMNIGRWCKNEFWDDLNRLFGMTNNSNNNNDLDSIKSFCSYTKWNEFKSIKLWFELNISDEPSEWGDTNAIILWEYLILSTFVWAVWNYVIPLGQPVKNTKSWATMMKMRFNNNHCTSRPNIISLLLFDKSFSNQIHFQKSCHMDAWMLFVCAILWLWAKFIWMRGPFLISLNAQKLFRKNIAHLELYVFFSRCCCRCVCDRYKFQDRNGNDEKAHTFASRNF